MIGSGKDSVSTFLKSSNSSWKLSFPNEKMYILIYPLYFGINFFISSINDWSNNINVNFSPAEKILYLSLFATSNLKLFSLIQIKSVEFWANENFFLSVSPLSTKDVVKYFLWV